MKTIYEQAREAAMENAELRKQLYALEGDLRRERIRASALERAVRDLEAANGQLRLGKAAE